MSAAPDLEGILLEPATEEGAQAPSRTRKRPKAIELGDGEGDRIVQRVIEFADDAEQDRHHDIENRLQRHAKLMQWAEDRVYPWPGAHPVSSPTMMMAVLRTEDTLQNAAMSTRPMMNASALDKANKGKERKIDLHQDHQFFVENTGEKLLEGLSCDFVREGEFTAHVRWIKEYRRTTQVRSFSRIPFGVEPRAYFRQVLDERWPTLAEARELPDSDGWDWKGREDEQWYTIRFYTDDEEGVEMEIQADLLVFDGPCITRIPYERVLAPVACENLQAPGPSNPNGAPFVVIVDYPTVDEVRRLVVSGVYDLLTTKEVDDWAGTRTSATSMQERQPELERQKREIRGLEDHDRQSRHDSKNHNHVVRLTCYDLWAREGEGESEDVVWTVIEDMQKLARAKPLGEVSPGNPPRRPLAEAAMIPIPGQRTGIGLPELMEQLHDWEVKVKEQMIDAADIEITPTFQYRQGSQVNPERYRVFPGSGWPVGNIGDVQWDQRQLVSGPVALNQLSLIRQDREGLVSIGDLQLGKIPAGKSSALRTASGIQQVLAQGEARPERILRRFFLGLRDIYRLMFQLNRFYLDKTKAFRATGPVAPDEDPWISIDKEDLSGSFEFDFQANVLNTGRLQLQESLSSILQMTLNPLMIQLGLATPETLYRVVTDYFRALGQTPEKYLNEPTPGAGAIKITAPDAVASLLDARMPMGDPQEPIEDHLATMQEIMRQPNAQGVPIGDTLGPAQQMMLQVYIQNLVQKQQQALAAQQQAALAGPLAQQLGQQGGGGPPAAGGGGKPTLVNQNEVLDESLPASGTPQ